MPKAMQLRITIKPEGQLEQMASAFKGLDLWSDLSRLIKKLSFRIQRESKKVTPVRTGFLKSSIIVWLEPLRGLIHPFAHYAAYVHEGTGIYAGRGRWKGKIPGVGWRWIKGMRPRPFMQWGLDKVVAQSQPEEDFKGIKYKLSKAMGGNK